MGNAPSTSNPNSPMRKLTQLARSSTTTSTSTISHLIPGAEPPSPQQAAAPKPEHHPPTHEAIHVSTTVRTDEDRAADLEHRPTGEVARFLEEYSNGDVDGGATPKPALREELVVTEAEVLEAQSQAHERAVSDDPLNIEAGLQFGGGYDVSNIRPPAVPGRTPADDTEAPALKDLEDDVQIHDTSPSGDSAHDGASQHAGDHEHAREQNHSTHIAADSTEDVDRMLSHAYVEGHHDATERSRTKWTPGVYVLINMKSGTSLDLAGHDHKSVIGWPTHGGPNQQWEFVPSGQGYIIRSAAATSEYGLYLTVKQSISDGAELDVCEFPMSWRAQHDEHNDALRILWSNTEYALCLADNGNMAPGTKAELRSLTPGDPSQMWRFAKCASTTEDQERAARAVAQPFATETVIVAEGQDCTTITRTMTTTTVETVTTVTRIAHARHG